MIHKRVLAATVGVALAVTLAACSSSRGSSDAAGTTSAAATSASAAASSSAGTKSSGSASSGSAAAGSGAAVATGNGELIGVTMPTSSSQRWIQDGDNVKKQLEAAGYKVDLQYAENDIPTQINQVDNQITNGAKVLIIASIDGTALTSQLQNAADNGIKVISYDRLIRNSPYVDYYATFDNEQVGVDQANSLLVGLGLLNQDGTPGSATGPFNIELFRRAPLTTTTRPSSSTAP